MRVGCGKSWKRVREILDVESVSRFGAVLRKVEFLLLSFLLKMYGGGARMLPSTPILGNGLLQTYCFPLYIYIGVVLEGDFKKTLNLIIWRGVKM
jgi:hypothetical protein